MTYATQTDLEDRFGEEELIQLTDRTNTPAMTVDASVVARALTDADAQINGYLGKRYVLPLADPVPPVLVKIACDIARYFLHGDRAGKDSPVTMAWRDAERWLANVAVGKVALEGATGEPAAEGGGEVRIDAPDRVFSRDRLRGL